jgi:hypothetical protein
MRGTSGEGAIIALNAIGPQDGHLDGNTRTFSDQFTKPSRASIGQRVVNLSSSAYIGNTVRVELRPKETGDLIGNMHLKCSLPALPLSNIYFNPYGYTDQIGRAIIKKVSLFADGQLIEELTDDWYIIRDQIFLDADERLSMNSCINGGANLLSTSTTVSSVCNSQIDMMIPLDFFFCRRHSHFEKNKQRLDKPFLPMCAMWNQIVYIVIEFNEWSWFCNNPTKLDLVGQPQLIVEEIYLSEEERAYFKSSPHEFKVNKVKKEAVLSVADGSNNAFRVPLTAAFPVSLLLWAVKRKSYETNTRFYDARYSFGYTTDFITSSVNYTNFSGIRSQYIDILSSAQITLNNIDILSTFATGLYFSFKVPMDSGLTVPIKNIYMYSFGLTPKEYTQGGYIDFSKLKSNITRLTINFNPEYAVELQSQYNMFVYYYGYTTLSIADGYARIASL